MGTDDHDRRSARERLALEMIYNCVIALGHRARTNLLEPGEVADVTDFLDGCSLHHGAVLRTNLSPAAILGVAASLERKYGPLYGECTRWAHAVADLARAGDDPSGRLVALLAPVRLDEHAVDLLEVDGLHAVTHGLDERTEAEVARAPQDTIRRPCDQREGRRSEGLVRRSRRRRRCWSAFVLFPNSGRR